jgi:hypothetical protein
MPKSLRDILNRKVRKTRDPYWRQLRALGKHLVPAKKGTGSYNRNKQKKEGIDGEI